MLASLTIENFFTHCHCTKAVFYLKIQSPLPHEDNRYNCCTKKASSQKKLIQNQQQMAL